MSNKETLEKFTTEDLDRFGSYMMNELAYQVGGIDQIAEVTPSDVMQSTGITVDLVKKLQADFDKLVIVVINEGAGNE